MHKSDDEIFCCALEFDSPEQQDQSVESACQGDAKQATRVRKLLRIHRKMQKADRADSSVLDRAELVFQTFASNEELQPGARVGAYELIEQIGEGGVGVVFRAEQYEPIERDVAIKLLKPGMDSQRILARFALERQVLQQLEHPGITRILDAGVQENGRPYFAMELVRNATTITDYAARFELSLQQRVRLMIAVCEIVQFAHQRGIIHRDLKPSNLLLEAKQQDVPIPKVIDFGIAKIVRSRADESQTFTNLGERFGTPAYMSPEQALNQTNDVDIRSDVYSLGVVLFELLTGSTPRSHSSSGSLSTGWTQETFWADDLTAPSQWQADHSVCKINPAELRGELDWMTLKALARHSDDRYQTVADFQRDLERFLAGEPVEAAGPSWTYRVTKLIRRNRVAAVASALVLVTVVATSIVTSGFAVRAYRAETAANDRLEEVLTIQQELESERDSADQARRQAETMLRVFQVQTATGRALAAHYQSVFSNPQLQNDPKAVQRFASELKTSVLLEPHARLIVRGDWQWASEEFPDEILLDQLKLSSKDVAAELSVPPSDSFPVDPRAAGTASNGSTVNGSAENSDPNERTMQNPRANSSLPSFRVRLLDELKKVVGADDPFIAEVLDNSGLDAMERGEFEAAERHLRDAASIWSKSANHSANLVQSKLFLAEALLKQAKLEEARTVSQEAQKLIGTLPADGPHTEPLRAFLQELSAS